MKKLNLICASIALLAAGAVNAGTGTSTARVVAIENFGGSTSAATDAVLANAITYSMTNITAVNAGATVYFTIRLTGGKFAIADGTGAAAQFSFGGIACAAAATTTVPGCTILKSTDRSTIRVTVAAPTATSTTLGLGAFAYTPAAADVNAVNSTLATVGGKVSASVALTTVQPTAFEATDAQSSVDGNAATGDLVVAAKSISSVIGAGTGYTGSIDLTATPSGSVYTTTKAVLGSATFTNVTGTQNRAATNADYTLAIANGTASVVVTPGAGQAFPEGSVLELHTNATCTAVMGGLSGSGTTAFTAANAGTAKTIASTDVVTTGTEMFVCMTAPGANKTATPIQATLAATLTPATTTDSVAVATGTGYNLAYNGSSVDVYSYWPGGLSAYNFTGYLRVTNTGRVTADVSLAHVSPTDGAAGTAKVIIAGLTAGKTVLLTTQAIDAVVGAAPSGVAVGRARVTAPTNALKVQSLLQYNSGNLVEFAN